MNTALPETITRIPAWPAGWQQKVPAPAGVLPLPTWGRTEESLAAWRRSADTVHLPPRRRGRTLRRWLLGFALGILGTVAALAALLTGASVAAAVLGPPLPAVHVAALGATRGAPAPSPTPGPGAHVTATSYRVIFHLAGDSSGAANVTWGRAGHPHTAAAETPILVPFTASLPWKPGRAYTITAQQYGPGSVQATVICRKIEQMSDGTRRVKDATVAAGASSYDGGYATARWAN